MHDRHAGGAHFRAAHPLHLKLRNALLERASDGGRMQISGGLTGRKKHFHRDNDSAETAQIATPF